MEGLKKLGFRLVKKDVNNKMFVVLVVRKDGERKKGKVVWPELKACVYKRR